MKQEGKRLTGDPVRLERYTADWPSARLHPASFYRRFDEIVEGFNDVKGLYTDIDCGQYILVRFSEKEDLTAFHRRHHTYL